MCASVSVYGRNVVEVSEDGEAVIADVRARFRVRLKQSHTTRRSRRLATFLFLCTAEKIRAEGTPYPSSAGSAPEPVSVYGACCHCIKWMRVDVRPFVCRGHTLRNTPGNGSPRTPFSWYTNATNVISAEHARQWLTTDAVRLDGTCDISDTQPPNSRSCHPRAGDVSPPWLGDTNSVPDESSAVQRHATDNTRAGGVSPPWPGNARVAETANLQQKRIRAIQERGASAPRGYPSRTCGGDRQHNVGSLHGRDHAMDCVLRPN
jgi:hypothetical protein